MKQFLTLYLLTICFLNGNCQEVSSWNTNSSYEGNQAKLFLSKIDSTIYAGSDLQIRLWYSNGWSRTNINSLLLMVNKNKSWKASYYTFSKKMRGFDTLTVEQKPVLNLSIDSIYRELVKNNLLTIQSDSIGFLLDRKGNSRWNWTDSGPTMYLIEIITPSKKWALRYPCPKYFYERYKGEEFIAPLKIITLLMSLLGLSPC